MNIVRQILLEIREGKKSFRPVSNSHSDMEDFQSVAKVLIHADQQGWLNSCIVHRESRTANDQYDLILVEKGISYEGEQYLDDIPSDNNTNSSAPEDIIEVKPSIFGVGVNLNALMRWWKKRTK
jgi:hypothetical protein